MKKHSVFLAVVALLFYTGAGHAGNADIEVIDPWEGYNRAVFRFNDALDRTVMKPAAKGYRAVMPDFAEQGVGNFFSNLIELRSILNDLLQGKLGEAGRDSGRFLVNSTVGVAGLIDVARHIGLPQNEHEDFGQTLGHWGVGSGPYLVLPVFGASTLRDTAGFPVDWYSDPITYIDHDTTRWSFRIVDTLQVRASLLEAEELISGDKYSFIRDAYLQRREYLIKGAPVEDDFGLEDSEYGDYDF